MQNANNGDLRSVVQLGYPCLDRTSTFLDALASLGSMLESE